MTSTKLFLSWVMGIQHEPATNVPQGLKKLKEARTDRWSGAGIVVWMSSPGMIMRYAAESSLRDQQKTIAKAAVVDAGLRWALRCRHGTQPR
jgi:hypothetical protein